MRYVDLDDATMLERQLKLGEPTRYEKTLIPSGSLYSPPEANREPNKTTIP